MQKRAARKNSDLTPTLRFCAWFEKLTTGGHVSIPVFALIASTCGVGAATAAALQAASAPAVRIAIQDDHGRALPVLDRAGSLPFAVAVRMVALREEPEEDLNGRLALFVSRKVPIWLAVPAPARLQDIESWAAAVRRLVEQHGAHLTILEIVVDSEPLPVAAYAVRLASTEAGAARSTVRLALGGAAMAERATREQIYTSDMAPYIDLLSVPEDAAEAATAWLARTDPTASVAITIAGDGANEVKRHLPDVVLRGAATSLSMSAWPITDGLPDALRTVAPAAALLSHDIVELDDGNAALKLSVAGGDVGGDVLHRLLFDNETFATYLAYWGPAAAEPMDVSARLTIDGTPVVHDLVNGARFPAAGYVRDAATRDSRIRVPLTGGPALVDFNAGAVNVFAERSDVRGERMLTVAEVIARHQIRQRLQDALVKTYMAHARMEQHFRPTMTDSGYDIVTENRYFVTGADVEWEELSFAVNGNKWGADRPPFPFLQPEKVLSLPLQLRFDEGYRYRLDGAVRVDGHDCYVVRFEPLRADPSLYRGTVWIDRQTFARIRVQAVQGGLAAPVVSNEETQDYTPPALVDGQPVYLLRSLKARQIMLIAGRNLLVEKSVSFLDFRVNDPQFEDARATARNGDQVMFRETDRGLRYYVKRDGIRMISERATDHAKALAMGTYFDPSYAFPLPIFGINYLDFDFGGPDSQLALLFGGVLAAGNVQRPKLGRTPFDASVDFFAIAAPSSDRVYDTGGERAGERLLTWPLSTGANLGWQYTPFQKATFQYQFRFDGYVRDTTTSEAFAVPSSTITQGIGMTWEYRRGGVSLVVSGTQFRRGHWGEWGLPQAGETLGKQSYAKYSGSISRDFYLNLLNKIHLNGAFFGGQDLDRFSEYQFGMFDDTRIHGVPASGVRFGELAMARGSYSLNMFDLYRLDLFLEQAWGRDRQVDSAWQPVSGFGVAVNLRAPKNTILRADFGRSVLPARYRNVGATTLQVLLLKPLG